MTFNRCAGDSSFIAPTRPGASSTWASTTCCSICSISCLWVAVRRRLDGPLAPIPCVSKAAYEPCTCPEEASCGLRIAMQQVRDAIAGILDNYKLDRLIEEVKKHRNSKTTEWQFDI